jgi:hypothetical protein
MFLILGILHHGGFYPSYKTKSWDLYKVKFEERVV